MIKRKAHEIGCSDEESCKRRKLYHGKPLDVVLQEVENVSLVSQVQCKEVLQLISTTTDFHRKLDNYLESKFERDGYVSEELRRAVGQFDVNSCSLMYEYRIVKSVMMFLSLRNVNEETDEILEALNMDLSIDRNLTVLLLAYRALVSSQKHEYKRAIADLNRAIDLEQNSAVLKYGRATCNAKAGSQPELVLSDLTMTISLDPYKLNAYFDRAREYMKRNQYREAVADLRKFISLSSSSSDSIHAQFMLSECYMKLRLRKQALESLRRVASINPDYKRVSVVIGLMLIDTGDLEAAISQFNSAMVVSGGKHTDRSLWGRSTCYIKLGRYEDAIADCHAATMSDEETGRLIQLNLYYVYNEQKMHVVALQWLNQVLLSNPQQYREVSEELKSGIHQSSRDQLF